LNNDCSKLLPFVLDKDGNKCNFSKEYIFIALRRETSLTIEQAEHITFEVTRLIISVSGNVKYFTPPMIREFTNYKLIEHGFEADRLKHTRIGIPKYDLDIILSESENGSNIPDHIKIKIAEQILKENEDVDNLYNQIQANGTKEIKQPSIKSIPQ